MEIYKFHNELNFLYNNTNKHVEAIESERLTSWGRDDDFYLDCHFKN